MKTNKISLNELRTLVKQIITEEENNTLNQYLPPDLKNNQEALKIMESIISLLDLLNDPNIDQTENGVSDKMRDIASHMIKSNI